MKANTRHYYAKATGYVDIDLKLIFRKQPMRLNRRQLFSRFKRADAFIKQHKQSLISRIANRSGVDTTVVHDVLDKLVQRAHVLNLWLEKAESDKKLIELTAFITRVCVNYKHTGLFFPERSN